MSGMFGFVVERHYKIYIYIPDGKFFVVIREFQLGKNCTKKTNDKVNKICY